MGAVTELHDKSRAKINLTLHVGPPMANGYHPLQSLVVFADVGDELSLVKADGDQPFSLKIDGQFGHGLSEGDDNLVLRAAEMVGLPSDPMQFLLTKNLPIASGIGGGSADAAAAIRLICKHEGRQVEAYAQEAAILGADIPACLHSQTCIMSGRGEHIEQLPNKGQLHAVLVNPGASVSTAEIFGLFDETDHFDADLEAPDTTKPLLEIAKLGRNDLQNTAISLCPEIVNVLAEIEALPNCQLARMSGSGATCFGLFSEQESAEQAARVIALKNPDWWCVSTVLGDTA